jgi:hypothetical protein
MRTGSSEVPNDAHYVLRKELGFSDSGEKIPVLDMDKQFGNQADGGIAKRDHCCISCGRDMVSEMRTVEAARNLTLETPKELFLDNKGRCLICADYYHKKGFDRGNALSSFMDNAKTSQANETLSELAVEDRSPEHDSKIDAIELMLRRVGLRAIAKFFITEGSVEKLAALEEAALSGLQ